MSFDKTISWAIMVIAFCAGLTLGFITKSTETKISLPQDFEKSDKNISKNEIANIIISEKDQSKWKHQGMVYSITGEKATNYHADGNLTDSAKAEIVDLPSLEGHGDK